MKQPSASHNQLPMKKLSICVEKFHKSLAVIMMSILLGCDSPESNSPTLATVDSLHEQVREPIWAWTVQSPLHELCNGEPRGDFAGRWEISLLNNIPVSDYYFSLVASDGDIKGRLACSNVQELDALLYEAKSNVVEHRLLLNEPINLRSEVCVNLELKRFDEKVIAILSSQPEIIQQDAHLCIRGENGESMVFIALPQSVSAFSLVRDPARKQ